jgi:hypothetical protein
MNVQQTERRIKGTVVRVPSVTVEHRTVVSIGRWLKVASVTDEELIEGDTVSNPQPFINSLRTAGLPADIFTFSQRLPDIVPRYSYPVEWDNVAAIPIVSFTDWWDKRVEYDVRKAVKRAKRLGVTVQLSTFNDAFVEGVCQIYNESPIRQGRKFSHYGKDFATIKDELATYLNRSEFLGAYYEGSLIGFIKMVYVGKVATTLHVISRIKYFDKKPMNALIAKAVEICESRGMSHFAYGSYTYNDSETSLTEFKRRNGFEKIVVPRYYIPLTLIGRIALRFRLHHPLPSLVPGPLMVYLRKLRGQWTNRRLRPIAERS